MFAAQSLVALATGGSLYLLAGPQYPSPSSPLGLVLVLLALGQLALGLLLPGRLAMTGAPTKAMAAALLAAVLLATPAWFLMLALLAGQGTPVLLLLLLILAWGFAAGYLFLCGRLAGGGRREKGGQGSPRV